MRDTIADIIVAQRMVTLYRPAEQSAIAGDQHVLANADEATAWRFWNKRIQGHNGPRIVERSTEGVPQTSGNCTVMSIQVMEQDFAGNSPLNIGGILKHTMQKLR